MTHFNGEGIVRMREKLAKLESRQERDLLHRFPPLLVVFSFQTFSEFISYAIFFLKSTCSENPEHDHTSNKSS